MLIVDDAPATVEVLRRNLASRGYEVLTATNAMDAIRIVENTGVDLVITDLRMPGVDGTELARHIVENHNDVEVVMITGYGSIQNAVAAMKAGVAEYLTKPFTDEELFAAVHAALEKLSLRRADRGERSAASRAPQGLIGESKVMRDVFRLIEKAAAVSAPVLITGESGTGKEMAARAIHYGGPRSSAPFVPVNCSAIPEGLIESELFGYVKGAFTGADQTRAGYFQTAEGGTLFLDEIAETSPSMQAKLLRALQDGEIAMVGSHRAHRVDVRVVAASNKDLAALVEKGRFREDLFYRLNVIAFAMPPLRDREDDLLLLLRHFTERFCEEHGREPLRFTPQALSALRRYAWPGNVRELSNVVQRIVLMNESGPVDAPDLPSLMRFTALRGKGDKRTLAEVESAHIAEVLASVRGNRSRAAQILGIDRKTLAARLRRAGPFHADGPHQDASAHQNDGPHQEPGRPRRDAGENLHGGENLPT
jgi:DNA-binding NtrC family response regulator